MEIWSWFARSSTCRIVFAMGAWGLLPTIAHAESLRLVTGELPPYATRERQDDGIALDIVRKAFANLWNKDDDRVFPPKNFGWGWDLNFHALLKRIKVSQSK